jgi:IMP dehydrogenase/GMP reductase
VKEALTFDDVLIIPGYSEVESRFDPSTESPFIDLPVPVISANMDSVTEERMAIAIEEAGGLGVLHRFLTKEELIDMTIRVAKVNKNVAVSLGIGDPERVGDWAMALADAGATTLVVDVAHGWQKRVLECIESIRDRLDNITIVAGNIATSDAAYAMWQAGVDAVKVGIGPGAACTTRTTTGVGYPQLSAILDVCKHRPEGLSVIADGGVKNTGDFCKAIAAGADVVMMGSIFAGCDESPGEIVYPSLYEGTQWGSSPTIKKQEPHFTNTPWFTKSADVNYVSLDAIRDPDSIFSDGTVYSYENYPYTYPNSDNDINKNIAIGAEKVYRGMASSEAREAFGISDSTGYNEHIAEGVSGRVPYTGPVADTVSQYKKALQSSMSYVGASSIREFHEKAEFVKVTGNTIIESKARV